MRRRASPTRRRREPHGEHWQLLELARDEALTLDEDPDAIKHLVAAGLLEEDDGRFITITVYPLSRAGRELLARLGR